MEFANLKEDVRSADRVDESRVSITELQELELTLIGGGMGDVLQ